MDEEVYCAACGQRSSPGWRAGPAISSGICPNCGQRLGDSERQRVASFVIRTLTFLEPASTEAMRYAAWLRGSGLARQPASQAGGSGCGCCGWLALGLFLTLARPAWNWWQRRPRQPSPVQAPAPARSGEPEAAPAMQVPQPCPGEIALAGVLEGIGGGGFWIMAERFQLPGRPWRAIVPPKSKRIEGSPAMEVSLPDGWAGLRSGARVQVIGRDDGSGKSLPARLVCQDDAGTAAGAGSGS